MASRINLTISRQLERRCLDHCKSWFPLEAYGILLGTMVGDSVHVDEVWTPSRADGEECFKKDRVYVKGDWVQEIADVAEDEGLIVLGDFHSHTYLSHETRMDPVMSELDLDLASRHAIFGVVNVEQSIRGRLSARVRWWGPSIKVRMSR